jgi:hypothetical protein
VVVGPVAGVGEHDLRALLDTGTLERALGRRDDGVGLLEVAALGGDLGGHDDLLLGDCRLGVVSDRGHAEVGVPELPLNHVLRGAP